MYLSFTKRCAFRKVEKCVQGILAYHASCEGMSDKLDKTWKW